MNTLAIACVSWKKTAVFKRTLDTYKRNGLLDYANESIVYFNEINDTDIRVAQEYSFTHILGSNKNQGIGRAFKTMASSVRSKYIIFLENDFTLIEDATEVKRQLDLCKALLRNDGLHVIKLRHRLKPGEPLYSRGLVQSDRFLSMVHWAKEEIIPAEVHKEKHRNLPYWWTTAEHGNYTNNPCIYKTSVFLDIVGPFCKGTGIALEGDIQPEWVKRSDIRIGQTEGLFCHQP